MFYILHFFFIAGKNGKKSSSMSVTAWYVTAMSVASENVIEKVTDLRLKNLLYFVNPSLLELLSSPSVSWNCIFQK